MSVKNVEIHEKTPHITEITAGNGDSKARIKIEGNHAYISLTENGNHWSGSMLSKENVENAIAVLEAYKENFL